MARVERTARRDERVAVSLFGAVGALVALAVSFLSKDDVSGAWRMTGGLLELAGFSTVDLSLGHKLRPFTDRPPIIERIRRPLRRAWRWILAKLGRQPERRVVSMKTAPYEHTVSGADARLSVRPANDAEPERWIEYLDEEFQALRERVSMASGKHQERMDRIEKKLPSCWTGSGSRLG